jgi:hypothetical protein
MRASVIISFLWCLNAVAQWEIPTQLQLNGPSDADRQVTGLAIPQSATDGVSVDAVRYQRTTHASAAGIDQLGLTLNPAPTAYTAGMSVSFEPASPNTGAATLVFDGAAFQLTTQSHPSCPSGFLPLLRDVCVEAQVGDTASFYGAAYFCNERGTRMCTWAEWYKACSMPGGILPSVVAYEWVDAAANHANWAKRVGQDDSMLIGCDRGGLAIPQDQHRYRCCWDR